MSLSVYFQLFPCHLCEKDYKWRSSLDKHLKGCHGEAQFECQSCSKAFRYKTCLEKHVATKHNLKEFMCDLCGAKYASKWGLTRHCRVHKEPNNNLLLCRECGKGYSRTDLLEAHERTHSPKTKCDKCEKEVYHIKEHTKYCSSLKRKQIYQCKQCTKKFKELRYLQAHIKGKHNPTDQHQCENCDAKYNYRASLLNHRRTCKK